MFLVVLIAVLVGAAAHLLRSGPLTRKRAGHLLLVWVLAGYCGLPMLVVSAVNLVLPDLTADVLGFPPGNPFQAFLGWAYLGMSIIATLAVRYRGSYLIGPAIVWAVFFAGATAVHLEDMGSRGAVTHGGAIGIFAMHGLVSVLLVGGAWASGMLARASGAHEGPGPS